MGGGEKNRLFISHGPATASWTAELASALTELDATVTPASAADVAPGGGIRDAVGRMIEDSDAIVLLVSPMSTAQENFEWSEALQAQWRNESRVLVPVLLDGALPPPFLRGIPHLEASLEQAPDEKTAGWILRQLERPPAAPDADAVVAPMLAQPWIDHLGEEIDTRSDFLRRLDAIIATLLEEKPDEDELREHRAELKRSLGTTQEPKELALTHLNVGIIDLQLRDFDSALDNLNTALDICEAGAGDGYPNRVSILIPLADTLAEMEEFADALKKLRQAIELRTDEDGGESPRVIAVKQELGAMLVRAHEFKEAAEVLAHTLSANQRELGKGHPKVEANKMWLAIAEEHLDNADSSTATDFLGLEPLTKVTRLVGLGYTMIEIGDFCGAQTALSRAVKLAEEGLNMPLPVKATCRFYNGIALCKSRQWADAAEQLRMAAEANKEAGIEEGWAASMFYLGTALRSCGRTDEAVRVLTDSLSSADSLYGHRSPEAAENLYSLGLALRDGGEFGEARERIDSAVRIASELAGNADPRVRKYQRALTRLDRVAA
jgi:tetratricopeptide (TPR) repeat protein